VVKVRAELETERVEESPIPHPFLTTQFDADEVWIDVWFETCVHCDDGGGTTTEEGEPGTTTGGGGGGFVEPVLQFESVKLIQGEPAIALIPFCMSPQSPINFLSQPLVDLYIHDINPAYSPL